MEMEKCLFGPFSNRSKSFDILARVDLPTRAFVPMTERSGNSILYISSSSPVLRLFSSRYTSSQKSILTPSHFFIFLDLYSRNKG